MNVAETLKKPKQTQPETNQTQKQTGSRVLIST